jgi:hypothetical protein
LTKAQKTYDGEIIALSSKVDGKTAYLTAEN